MTTPQVTLNPRLHQIAADLLRLADQPANGAPDQYAALTRIGRLICRERLILRNRDAMRKPRRKVVPLASCPPLTAPPVLHCGIVRLCERQLGLRKNTVCSLSRSASAIAARQLAAWVMRRNGRSISEIAAVLGRDTSTTQHHIRVFETKLDLPMDSPFGLTTRRELAERVMKGGVV